MSGNAPKTREEFEEISAPVRNLLNDQNPALLLALSPDAGNRLIAGASKITRLADVQVAGKAYPAISYVRGGDSAARQGGARFHAERTGRQTDKAGRAEGQRDRARLLGHVVRALRGVDAAPGQAIQRKVARRAESLRAGFAGGQIESSKVYRIQTAQPAGFVGCQRGNCKKISGE